MRQPIHDVGNLVVYFAAGIADCAILVYPQEFLLTWRIRTHVLYSEFWIHEFGEKKFGTHVCIFVLEHTAVHLATLVGRILHLASQLYMDFAYLAIFLPYITYCSQGFSDNLLHYRVAERVLLEVA